MAETRERKTTVVLQWVTLVVCAAILVVGLLVLRRRSDVPERIDERIALASALVNEGLLSDAIGEYEAALDLARGDSRLKANICYLIGKAYFESLHDYEKALAYFTRARHYNPQHPERSQMEKWTVASLERLGRSLDAHTRVAQATTLRPNETTASGTIVARIGGKPVTMAELDADIRYLPADEQKRLAEPKEKAAYLEEFIARRLISEAAARAGLEHEPRVLSAIKFARDQILSTAYYQREIEGKATVTPEEMKLYYDAHRDEFREPRRFDISHVELADEAAATSAAKALKDGGDLAALARKLSLNRTTGEKGGQVGAWNEGTALPSPLPDEPDLAKAIAALAKGQCTEPVKTISGGFQIVRADSVSSPTLQPFERVKGSIESRQRQEKEMKRWQEVLARLRQAENVAVYPEAFGPTKPDK